MKKIGLVCLCFLGACTSSSVQGEKVKYRLQTERQEPYYLSTVPEKVEDTCPGHDIIKQYNCSAKDKGNSTCFDVYMVQGRPVNEESYTLLKQEITEENLPSQATCPDQVTDCDSFLKALNYNLEFSWYLVNFPSSSFTQCRETYDCKRIDCSRVTAENIAEKSGAQLISCVYKKNQIFFVGSQITCQKQTR